MTNSRLPENFRRDGFTLVELIIVIFIISLTTALVMPALWDTGERALRSEAGRLGNTLRYIHDEAAGKKETYVLKVDLNRGIWGYESDKDSRSFEMQDNVIFRDVVIPSLGTVSTGLVTYRFGPMGPEEPVIFHLIRDRDEYTVMFNHLSGRAKVHKGYIIRKDRET